MFLVIALYLLFSAISSQRIQMVNLGSMNTEHITISVDNFRIVQNNNKNNNPPADSNDAKELEEINTIFAMFSLLDDLSNQIFQANDENPGFLSLDDIFQNPQHKHGKKQKREVLNDELQQDTIEFNKRNEEFNEAHVEFTDNSANNIKLNEQKVEESDYERKQNENNENIKENDEDIQNKEESDIKPEIIINSKKKEAIKNTSRYNKGFLLIAAIIIALGIFGLLKYKMAKLQNHTNSEVNLKKISQEQENKGD